MVGSLAIRSRLSSSTDSQYLRLKKHKWGESAQTSVSRPRLWSHRCDTYASTSRCEADGLRGGRLGGRHRRAADTGVSCEPLPDGCPHACPSLTRDAGSPRLSLALVHSLAVCLGKLGVHLEQGGRAAGGAQCRGAGAQGPGRSGGSKRPARPARGACAGVGQLAAPRAVVQGAERAAHPTAAWLPLPHCRLPRGRPLTCSASTAEHSWFMG